MTPYSLGIIRVATPGVPVSIGNVAATLVGTEVATFNIGATSDKLLVGVDGGVAQLVTLTHGAARTASQVAGEINSGTSGITASVAANKVVLSSNTTGPTSEIKVEAVTNSANTVLGLSTAAVFGASDTRFAKMRVVPLPANSGVLYVGDKVNFDSTTGDGLLDVLLAPLATPATLDRWVIESQEDENVLHTSQYFLDAAQANDGAVVVIWVR